MDPRVSAQYRDTKRRAKRDGVVFRLTKRWFKENTPTHCPVLGIPLRRGNDTPRDVSPSVDRLVPEDGYTPQNCRIISWRANRLKSNATPEELMAVAVWLQRETDEYWRSSG